MLLGARYSKLQPADPTSYKAAFEEENLPSFAFPQASVVLDNGLLTAGNNTIHTLLSRGPHAGYSIVLKVTGGSLKSTNSQT